jgi:beta-1,4-galactosyltransferase 1
LYILIYIYIHMYKNIIVIPYRNREEHLKYFINKSVPLIKETMPETKIVVVEQTEGKLFNRGKILNVGFKEYMDKTEYFITHDVDINPTKKSLELYYNLENDIVRIVTGHNQSLGGITKLHNKCIKEINGFPNYIWGWGIEDRALYHRAIIKQSNILNTKINRSYFKILNHTKNCHKYQNEKKIISEKWKPEYINSRNDEEKNEMVNDSGLNTIEYNIIERKQLDDIVELIKVEI